MSDYSLFCVFCDTIVKRSEDLRQHLATHFSSDSNQCQKTITKSETDFIERTIAYQKALKNSLKLTPKELPKDNVSKLLEGCPVCDAIINCFQLVVKRDKKQCVCGHIDERLGFYECRECQQFTHYICEPVNQSTDFKCVDCSSKAFEISHLNSCTTDEQREHCFKHFDYYPFRCAFESCLQKFFTVDSSAAHLENNHNFEIESDADVYQVLQEFYEYEPIEEIEDFIEGRLKRKISFENMIASPPMTPPVLENFGLNVNNRVSSKGKSKVRTDYMSALLLKSKSKGKKVNPKEKEKPKEKTKPIEKMVRNIPQINYESDDSHTGYRYRIFNSSPNMSSNSDLILIDHNLSLGSQRKIIPTPEPYSDNWFRQIKPTKSPYFPQKDDKLAYIPYGHQLFKEEVVRRGLYNQSNVGNSIRKYINDVIFGHISKIDFLFKPKRNGGHVRQVYITFIPDKKYALKYGTIIHLKYHDTKNVMDFVVLKEIYESAVERIKDWKIGDQFRSIIGDKYWFGTIKGINDAEYSQTSKFMYYLIEWTNGDAEYLSPWDIEPINGCFPQNGLTYVKVTDEDRRNFFISRPDEWPQRDEFKECKRVVNGLEIVLTMDKAKEFGIIDDINGETGVRYREKILYPIDIKTIIARINSRYYRTHTAMKYDLKFILANIRKLLKLVKKDPEFKFEESVRKKLKYNTKFIIALCLIFIDSHCDGIKNPYDIYHNIDDYIENHDVNCYSAKRVHLNLKRKVEYLPVPWRRTRDYVPRGGRGVKKVLSERKKYRKSERAKSCSSDHSIGHESEDDTHVHYQSPQQRNRIKYEKNDKLYDRISNYETDSDLVIEEFDTDDDSDYSPSYKKYKMWSKSCKKRNN